MRSITERASQLRAEVWRDKVLEMNRRRNLQGVPTMNRALPPVQAEEAVNTRRNMWDMIRGTIIIGVN